MADYGIKVSKPGIDVKTAKDINLQYSSTRFGQKIFKIVTAAVIVPANTSNATLTSVTVAHGFRGGIPSFLPFTIYQGSSYTNPTTIVISGVKFTSDNQIDGTNVTFMVSTNITSPGIDVPFSFKAFIFTNKLV